MTPTTCLGLIRKSLFPPTGMCFFMKLKLLRRQTSSPLLLTLRLKSSSSQLYLHTDSQTSGRPRRHLLSELRPSPLPRDVVLHVLREVHVQHDEVVQVAPTEGLAGGPASHVAAPLAGSEHCVQADLWREFHVLQHHLQGNVGTAGAPIRRFAERHRHKDERTVGNNNWGQNSIKLSQNKKCLSKMSEEQR